MNKKTIFKIKNLYKQVNIIKSELACIKEMLNNL